MGFRDNREGQTFIVGAGDHARVLRDAIRVGGGTVDGFLVSREYIKKSEIEGTPVLDLEILSKHSHPRVIIGVGDNFSRMKLVTLCEGLCSSIDWISVVHPNACIAKGVVISPGVFVGAGVMIEVGSILWSHVLVNTRAALNHDCILEEGVSIAPGAVLGGRVNVGRQSAICIGAIVSHGVNIGEYTVIGAGSIVTKSVASGLLGYGNPFQIIRSRSPEDSYL